ncbi:hypothetical protein [Kushneria phyllosphaerae]|uniref:Uncharacterized protein n=1 Tax=Kushneria phyllosphaerae TaxID=2100822 RepID=A0A2R8CQQ5_9GAMM|nr:hypothetical protein [Kushneria phyllosphaerae]SPJ35227.1 hypothetical protein KSP9073_03285 [Kushneria phyllosphaerae]
MKIDPYYQIDPSDSVQDAAQAFLRNQPRYRSPHQMVSACRQHLVEHGRLRADEAMQHAAYAYDQLNAQGGVSCTH